MIRSRSRSVSSRGTFSPTAICLRGFTALPKEALPWPLPRLSRRQDTANRGAADLEPTGDADAGAVQYANFAGFGRRCDGPAQLFAVLPCVGQASPRSVPQESPFQTPRI